MSESQSSASASDKEFLSLILYFCVESMSTRRGYADHNNCGWSAWLLTSELTPFAPSAVGKIRNGKLLLVLKSSCISLCSNCMLTSPFTAQLFSPPLTKHSPSLSLSPLDHTLFIHADLYIDHLHR